MMMNHQIDCILCTVVLVFDESDVKGDGGEGLPPWFED